MNAIVCGVDGDPNGAIRDFTYTHELRRTLSFEIGQLSDINKVNDLLDKLDVPLTRLTIAGHGGKRGIYISKTALLKREALLANYPAFKQLLSRIAPDEHGQRHVILNSCSQGRVYYDSGKSMAQIISEIDELTVTAAPNVAYSHPSKEPGEFVIHTNPYHDLGRFIEARGDIPGLVRLAAFLLDDKRRKPGVIRMQDGRKSVHRDGKVTIGE